MCRSKAGRCRSSGTPPSSCRRARVPSRGRTPPRRRTLPAARARGRT
uniref:Uncharacterized protein n=1 Tax=Arundo donax TaxID=35708 RepID=A0A0A9CXA6_ARUDO